MKKEIPAKVMYEKMLVSYDRQLDALEDGLKARQMYLEGEERELAIARQQDKIDALKTEIAEFKKVNDEHAPTPEEIFKKKVQEFERKIEFAEKRLKIKKGFKEEVLAKFLDPQTVALDKKKFEEELKEYEKDISELETELSSLKKEFEEFKNEQKPA